MNYPRRRITLFFSVLGVLNLASSGNWIGVDTSDEQDKTTTKSPDIDVTKESAEFIRSDDNSNEQRRLASLFSLTKMLKKTPLGAGGGGGHDRQLPIPAATRASPSKWAENLPATDRNPFSVSTARFATNGQHPSGSGSGGGGVLNENPQLLTPLPVQSGPLAALPAPAKDAVIAAMRKAPLEHRKSILGGPQRNGPSSPSSSAVAAAIARQGSGGGRGAAASSKKGNGGGGSNGGGGGIKSSTSSSGHARTIAPLAEGHYHNKASTKNMQQHPQQAFYRFENCSKIACDDTAFPLELSPGSAGVGASRGVGVGGACASRSHFPLDGVCPALEKSWMSARDYCEGAGLRLCSVVELARGLGINTGCAKHRSTAGDPRNHHHRQTHRQPPPFLPHYRRRRRSLTSAAPGSGSAGGGGAVWSSTACDPDGDEGWFFQVDQRGMKPLPTMNQPPSSSSSSTSLPQQQQHGGIDGGGGSGVSPVNASSSASLSSSPVAVTGNQGKQEKDWSSGWGAEGRRTRHRVRTRRRLLEDPSSPSSTSGCRYVAWRKKVVCDNDGSPPPRHTSGGGGVGVGGGSASYPRYKSRQPAPSVAARGGGNTDNREIPFVALFQKKSVGREGREQEIEEKEKGGNEARWHPRREQDEEKEWGTIGRLPSSASSPSASSSAYDDQRSDIVKILKHQELQHHQEQQHHQQQQQNSKFRGATADQTEKSAGTQTKGGEAGVVDRPPQNDGSNGYDGNGGDGNGGGDGSGDGVSGDLAASSLFGAQGVASLKKAKLDRLKAAKNSEHAEKALQRRGEGNGGFNKGFNGGGGGGKRFGGGGGVGGGSVELAVRSCLPAGAQAEISPVCCADADPRCLVPSSAQTTKKPPFSSPPKAGSPSPSSSSTSAAASSSSSSASQALPPSNRIAVLMSGETGRDHNPHADAEKARRSRCSEMGRARQMAAIESQKSRLFSVLKGSLGYRVDVFLATNDCDVVPKKRRGKKGAGGNGVGSDDDIVGSDDAAVLSREMRDRNERVTTAATVLAATPHSAKKQKEKKQGSPLAPSSIAAGGRSSDGGWGAALKKAYSPWLRGLSIDDCSLFPDKRCHLNSALKLFAQSIGSSGGASGGGGSGSGGADAWMGGGDWEGGSSGSSGGGGGRWSSSVSASQAADSKQRQRQKQKRFVEADELRKETDAFPYLMVVLTRPDLMLMPTAGPKLVLDLVEHPNRFTWPFKCEGTAWRAWRCVADTFVAVPGKKFPAFRDSCLGLAGCHSAAYADGKKKRFDATDAAMLLPFSGHRCFACVLQHSQKKQEFQYLFTGEKGKETGNANSSSSSSSSSMTNGGGGGGGGGARLEDTVFSHSQDLLCVQDKEFADPNKCEALCAAAPFHRCVAWTAVPDASARAGEISSSSSSSSSSLAATAATIATATAVEGLGVGGRGGGRTCCLKAFVSGTERAPGRVSGVLAPREAEEFLAGVAVGFAEPTEGRVVNTRIEAGRNAYYKFADSGHF